MSGPHAVRPTVLQPCEAWQVEAGNEGLQAAGTWAHATGLWGKDAPEQVVWIDDVRPARPGQWIVKTLAGPLVLSPEEFAAAWEVV